jgi:hypothetical protein
MKSEGAFALQRLKNSFVGWRGASNGKEHLINKGDELIMNFEAFFLCASLVEAWESYGNSSRISP